ncbi:MAG TPA: YraN family protein [Solirubrobacteraceae bacterium]|nr:YraN family protein [Solirubrobacteraceae bacterium]
MCSENVTAGARAVKSGDPAPRRVDPRRALGTLGEDLAAAHLARLGFSTLARNVRTRHGEIDLIVFDGHSLAFVEIKTRRTRACSAQTPAELDPLLWLRQRQRTRLRKLAAAWLADERRAGVGAPTIRFDAIGVIVDCRDRLVRLDHIEGAW